MSDARPIRGRSWLNRRPVDASEAAVDVGADPAIVYRLVTDVTSTGNYSPECQRVEWVGGSREAVPGARFRGRNRWRGFVWWREAVVTVAEEPGCFGFETIPGRGIKNTKTVWSYTLERTATGPTRICQRFEVYAPRRIEYLDRLLGRPGALRRNVCKSLERLKALAEDTAAAT